MVINGTKSDCAAETIWTPRGILLGAILSVIYINELPEVVNKDSYAHLHADDSTVFRGIASEDERKSLQIPTEWLNGQNVAVVISY